MNGPGGQNGFGLPNLNDGANIDQTSTYPPLPPLHQWPLPPMPSLPSTIPPSNHGPILNPSFVSPTFQQQLALLTASISSAPAIAHANLHMLPPSTLAMMPQLLLQQQTIQNENQPRHQPAQTVLDALNQYFPSIPQQRILPPQITSLNARMEQLKQSHDGYCKSIKCGIIDGIQSNLQIQYAKSNQLEQLRNYTRAISGGK